MIDRYFEIPIFRLANPNGKLREQKTRHCQLASNSFLTLLMKFVITPNLLLLLN